MNYFLDFSGGFVEFLFSIIPTMSLSVASCVFWFDTQRRIWKIQTEDNRRSFAKRMKYRLKLKNRRIKTLSETMVHEIVLSKFSWYSVISTAPLIENFLTKMVVLNANSNVVPHPLPWFRYEYYQNLLSGTAGTIANCRTKEIVLRLCSHACRRRQNLCSSHAVDTRMIKNFWAEL